MSPLFGPDLNMANIQKEGDIHNLLRFAKDCDEEQFMRALVEFFKSNDTLTLTSIHDNIEISYLLEKISQNYLEKIILVPGLKDNKMPYFQVEIHFYREKVLYLDCWNEIYDKECLRRIMYHLIDSSLRSSKFKHKVFLDNDEVPLLTKNAYVTNNAPPDRPLAYVCMRLILKIREIYPLFFKTTGIDEADFVSYVITSCHFSEFRLGRS